MSNAPFLPFGIWGILALRKARFHEPREARAYAVAFAATVLVGLGSSYYHWHPDNHTLFWDRLPMTLVFMGTAWIAFAILLVGKRFIPEVKYVEESGAPLLTH